MNNIRQKTDTAVEGILLFGCMPSFIIKLEISEFLLLLIKDFLYLQCKISFNTNKI